MERGELAKSARARSAPCFDRAWDLRAPTATGADDMTQMVDALRGR
jgi:hypothetical protein